MQFLCFVGNIDDSKHPLCNPKQLDYINKIINKSNFRLKIVDANFKYKYEVANALIELLNLSLNFNFDLDKNISKL